MKQLFNIGLISAIGALACFANALELGRETGGSGVSLNPGITYANIVKGKVEFSLPQQFDIDWGKYAPENIKTINMSKLSKADMDLINSGDANFSYKSLKFGLPVPPELRVMHFYLVNGQGVEEMVLGGLTGYAKFSLLEGEKLSPEPIEYFGKATANFSFKGSSLEGGFILVSSVPLKISTFNDTSIRGVFSAQAVSREIKYSYLHNNQKLTLSVHRNHLVEIDRLFKFRIEGLDAEYLFVNWHPDNKCEFGCCGNGYSLFRADKEFSELAGTVMDCDV